MPDGKGQKDGPHAYWAFCAHPASYRIRDALADPSLDMWTTKGKPVRAGDRAIIWKAKGREAHRRIVALGKVVSDPELLPDSDNPHWVVPPPPDEIEQRAAVRYVLPPDLPMWYGPETQDLLDTLSVARARGGTIFQVTPEQWEAVIEAVGGWPGDAPEVEDARDAIAERAGRKAAGRGFRIDAETRMAIELHAMAMAKSHYEAEGWKVEDVSSSQPYDLRCTGPGEVDLNVEVKGTTGDGSTILLTPNEVEHARVQHPDAALFIVAGVEVVEKKGSEPQVQGGRVVLLQPWAVDEGTLRPLGFSYDPPSPETQASQSS